MAMLLVVAVAAADALAPQAGDTGGPVPTSILTEARREFKQGRVEGKLKRWAEVVGVGEWQV